VDVDRLSDEQLMLMFRNGNRAAFAMLFERHRIPVFSFAYRMLNDRAAAEDVLQETFLHVARAASTYEVSAAFKTWLFKIARNNSLNNVRRKRMVSLDVHAPVAASLVEDPHDCAARVDLAARLEDAIAALAVEQREVFLLRFKHGMDYQQIADVTGHPLGTVKTWIHRARLELALKMRNLTGEQE
jgi:RNA polymerase sigma-70 factor, ECF subfamily